MAEYFSAKTRTTRVEQARAIWYIIKWKRTPANKKLFSGGPPENKKLFAGGPLANMKFFVGALSILYIPEWFYAVLSSLSLYCMVLYCHVSSFKIIKQDLRIFFEKNLSLGGLGFQVEIAEQLLWTQISY